MTLLTDEVFLSIIAFLIVGFIGIVGFFIKRWMDQTDCRDERTTGLIEKTNDALSNLNDTMGKINLNLEVYQMQMTTNLSNVKDRITFVDKNLDNHENHIQDHEVRIVVLEKNGNGK
jgi:hypothetical protein